MGLKHYIKLLRPQQWYKNTLIFLALIFGGHLFNVAEFKLTVIGFICLCLISSSNYIFNDILDLKADRAHPEKKKRPLASGKIKIWKGGIIAIILLIVSLFVSYNLSVTFFYFVLALFLLTQFYSLVLKREIFVDLLLISINFVLRAASGSYLIDLKISPWLILCPFFLALFLTTGKRISDLKLLGKKAAAHKAVLKKYTSEMTNALMIIATTSLILAYTLFAFQSGHHNLLLTIPFALYAIFRYMQLIYQGSKIARHPELLVTDKRMVIAGILWGLSTLFVLYYDLILRLIGF
ncbi:MAG: decaprenyl-phosphate phosphoribosyltransferase [Nanoarchaeota archaeon]|nr:decaprenyl-phosphate phosphoribosyltransferase [Nanoarchaeota archaeon]